MDGPGVGTVWKVTTPTRTVGTSVRVGVGRARGYRGHEVVSCGDDTNFGTTGRRRVPRVTQSRHTLSSPHKLSNSDPLFDEEARNTWSLLTAGDLIISDVGGEGESGTPDSSGPIQDKTQPEPTTSVLKSSQRMYNQGFRCKSGGRNRKRVQGSH